MTEKGEANPAALEQKPKEPIEEIAVTVSEEGADAASFVSAAEEEGTKRIKRKGDRQRVVSPLSCKFQYDSDAATTPTAVGGKSSPDGKKKVSPPRVQLSRTDVENERYASSLRSEERRRLAEERRLDHLQGVKTKLSIADEKAQRAKERREEAERRQRAEALERQENGVRRSAEKIRQTREKAERAHSRIEEVKLTKELQLQTKMLKITKKMDEAGQNLEQIREEKMRVAQGKKDALNAAAERRRNLSQEKIEKQQQRELLRQEKIRKVEEQKKTDLEMKQLKSEEWEKKIQKHQFEVQAEAEAISKKTEEKLAQSAQLREEQRLKLRQRQEKQEEKLKEARLRRDKEAEGNQAPTDFSPCASQQEEDLSASRVTKIASSSKRHGKIFTDNYRKETAVSSKDLTRSRLRPVFGRLQTAQGSNNTKMSRQALGDILSFKYAKDDHEFVRYFNCFGTLVDVYCDARKAGDFSLSRDALLILQNLFLDGGEGHENIAYFIRSGGLTQLAVAIMEDYRVHRTKTENAHLILPLTVIGICLEDVLGKFASNLKLNVVKDQLFNELEALGVDDFCVTVLKQSVHEAGTEVAYSALCILKLFASVYVKRKSEHRITHVQKLTGAPFAFCQSTFTKEYLTNNCKLGSARICVVFCAFRLLNILARCHIGCFQGLFHDTPKNVDKESLLQINRTELLHMFSIFFSYVEENMEELETIPPLELGGGQSASQSFEEACRFGITVADFPAFPRSPDGTKDVHLRAALHEGVLLIGYLCLDNPFLQEMLTWGQGKCLLKTIINVLPIPYFTNARHILFPTLLCTVLHNPRSVELVGEEMDIRLLLKFIKAEFEQLSKKAKAYADERHKALHEQWTKEDSKTAVAAKEGIGAPSLVPDISLSPLSPPEVETLCKNFRAVTSVYDFFKVDRRFPIAFWPSVIEDLEMLERANT